MKKYAGIRPTHNVFDLPGFNVIIDSLGVIIETDPDGPFNENILILPKSMAPLLRHMANCLDAIEPPYVKIEGGK